MHDMKPTTIWLLAAGLLRALRECTCEKRHREFDLMMPLIKRYYASRRTTPRSFSFNMYIYIYIYIYVMYCRCRHACGRTSAGYYTTQYTHTPAPADYTRANDYQYK